MPKRRMTHRELLSRLARPFWPVAILFLLLTHSAAATVSTGQHFEGQEPETSPADHQEESPLPTQSDTVLVQAPLPYIPTSNTIATKLPVDLAWTPAHVGVVESALLEEQSALVLGDALQNLSGLNVQTGSGVFDVFVVRGFDSLSSGLVLIDGAPEPEVSFYQLYNAERVELLKGPGGFLYGPNPLAGAVNIVRKQPVLIDFATVSASLGSFATLEGAVDLNRSSTDGEFSFRLNGVWRETEGYRDGRDGEVAAANPAFTWRPGQHSSLNVNLELLSSDYLPDAGLPLVDGRLPAVPRRRSYASPFDRSRQDITRLQVDFEHRFSDSLVVRNKTYYRELDWRTDGTLLGFVLPSPQGGTLVTRSLLLLDDRQEFVGDQLEVLWTTRTGPLAHRLLAGVELARFDDRFSLDVALLPPIDLFEPFESAAGPLLMLDDQSAAGDSRALILAPYVIDEIRISERLQVLIGVRYDSIDFEDDTSGVSRRDGELSPMLGAVLKPRERTSLYGNLARSFAPPSPRVSGERQPEESRQLEIGLREEILDGSLRLTLALFQLERQNIAIPDDNGFSQQVGDQRARGAELELAWEIPNRLRGLFAYGYTDSELTEFREQVLVPFPIPTTITLDRSGNRAAFTPEHLATLWLSRSLSSRWRVAGGLRYVGEQFIAEDNATRLDDALLINLALLYDRDSWQWSLHLHNVADEDYETRGFGAFSVIPGEPFSASARCSYRF